MVAVALAPVPEIDTVKDQPRFLPELSLPVLANCLEKSLIEKLDPSLNKELSERASLPCKEAFLLLRIKES